MTNGASADTEPPTHEGGLISPATEDNVTDGVTGEGGLVPRTTEEINTEICGDGIENDGDGLTDALDQGCIDVKSEVQGQGAGDHSDKN
jgi:hypothetical protein